MIFVLGAHGFLGSAFCSFFAAAGIPFEGITRENRARYRGRTCRYLINAAGNSSKRLAETEPMSDFDMNVTELLRIFGEFDIQTYLHLSSIDLYNDMADPAKNVEDAPIESEKLSRYGFHKWLGEQVVRRYAKGYVIFRLAGMFGKNSRKGPAHDIIHGMPLWVSPRSRFLFLDTATLARLVWEARDCEGETFNLAASENLSLEEFSRLLGKSIVEVRGDEVLNYRVNVDKIARLAAIPTSRESVLAAIRDKSI